MPSNPSRKKAESSSTMAGPSAKSAKSSKPAGKRETTESISHKTSRLPSSKSKAATKRKAVLGPQAIKLGGPAAQAFYLNVDLRRKLLNQLDSYTLTRVMRAEKGAVESVAEVLYHTVHISRVESMNRETVSLSVYVLSPTRVLQLTRQPARALYCNAVRHIDLSVPPHTAETYNPFLSGFKPPLDAPPHPEKIHRDVAAWRAKFPHLRSVRNEFPEYDVDHVFVVHVDGDKLTLDLEWAGELNVLRDRFPEQGVPYLPYDPFGFGDFGGIKVNHTVAPQLTVTSRYDRDPWDEEEEDSDEEEEGIKSIRAYRKWLYTDPKLDGNLTRIIIQDQVDMAMYFKPMSFSEALRFLLNRRKEGCSLMREFSIPPLYEEDDSEDDDDDDSEEEGDEDDAGRGGPQEIPSREDLRKMVDLIGPDLRILHVDASALELAGGGHALFSLLDKAFPRLQVLHLQRFILSDFLPKYWGMSHLRKMILEGSEIRGAHRIRDAAKFGRASRGIGREDCLFQNN